MGAGYSGVSGTTLIPDVGTKIDETSFYKLTTTNTYPIFPVQRLTVSGSGDDVGEEYTITVGSNTATFTTVVTITTNNAITSGIVSAVNNTAPLNTVIQAYDYEN